MKPELLTELIQRALDEEMGLIIKTNNQTRLVQELTAAKKALGATELIVARPSSPEEVFLVKKSVELDP